MRKLQARERIERGDLDGMNYQAVYDLYLEAYDDPRLAQQMQTKYLEMYVKQQCQRHSAVPGR
jgi:hypothetical protein